MVDRLGGKCNKQIPCKCVQERPSLWRTLQIGWGSQLSVTTYLFPHWRFLITEMLSCLPRGGVPTNISSIVRRGLFYWIFRADRLGVPTTSRIIHDREEN